MSFEFRPIYDDTVRVSDMTGDGATKTWTYACPHEWMPWYFLDGPDQLVAYRCLICFEYRDGGAITVVPPTVGWRARLLRELRRGAR